MSTNFDKLAKLYELEGEKEINGKKFTYLKAGLKRGINKNSYSSKLIDQNKIKDFVFGDYS